MQLHPFQSPIIDQAQDIFIDPHLYEVK